MMSSSTTKNIEPAPPPPVVLAIPVGDVDESPSNPRKTFAGVADLAEDLKRRGVLQPVLVRPSPVSEGRYELVFGARRFRATKLARIADIPAMVRTLTDEEVLEIQIVENSKREDIHPMEEADGYRALHETHGWPVEEIAAKVGKAPATVRQRLKMCALVPAAREAFLANRFTAGVALALARIPHADQQASALKDILDRQGDDEDPMTVQDAGWLVESHYMLVLATAPFDRGDATLVAGVPDCAACPKRTGNQREMFPDLSSKEDLCTDTKCWDGKKDATWSRELAAAKAKGAKVLSAKDAKDMFSPYGEHEIAGGAFVDLDAKTYDSKGRPHDNRTLVGGNLAELPVVIARDQKGRTRKLVAVADFKNAAKAAGNTAAVERFTKPSSRGVPAADVAAEKARRAREAKKRERFNEELTRLVAVAQGDPVNSGFWKTLARAHVDAAFSDTRIEVCRRRGLELKGKPYELGELATKRLCALVATLTGDEARGLIVELASSTNARGEGASFKAFIEHYGLGTRPKKAIAAKKKKPAVAAKPARKKR